MQLPKLFQGRVLWWGFDNTPSAARQKRYFGGLKIIEHTLAGHFELGKEVD
jgi:hypothetical protein